MVRDGAYPRVGEYVVQKARGRRPAKVGTRVVLTPHVIVELGQVVTPQATAIARAQQLAAAHT